MLKMNCRSVLIVVVAAADIVKLFDGDWIYDVLKLGMIYLNAVYARKNRVYSIGLVQSPAITRGLSIVLAFNY